MVLPALSACKARLEQRALWAPRWPVLQARTARPALPVFKVQSVRPVLAA